MQASLLGSVNPATGLGAIGIGSCTSEGITGLMHDPKTLNEMFNTFNNLPVPAKFANAVALNSQIFQQVSRVYDCPFTCSVFTTIPLAAEFVEATARSSNVNSYEFNIMRTVDFIGRNYLMIELPRVDCMEIKDSECNNKQDPHHCYLGAWHRDLVPRIIRSVSFYSRSNNHILFDYSGYDIYLFNLLFGNSQKELNDVMAGEDNFELAYDPYYVNGAALGLASFRGIDPFDGIVIHNDNTGTVTKVIESLQVDTTMDKAAFREFYRRGVWFETPYMKNAASRHSIHSRRMIHNAKTLWIPLDILPFGYSIQSAIPVGAVHGEVGYVRVDIYQDWLDRAFYITRLSDIPSICPMLNHKHYANGDIGPDGKTIGSIGGDPRLGWVNEMSAGRFMDPTFNGQEADPARDMDAEDDARPAYDAFNSIIDGKVGSRETNVNHAADIARPNGNGALATFASATENRMFTTDGFGNNVSFFDKLNRTYRKGNPNDEINTYILPISRVCTSYHDHVKNLITVRLVQVGYKTLPCIRDLINKLPGLYVATEWADTEYVPSSRPHIEVLNDLFIQGIAIWVIPEDNTGIESMRMYPNHYVDHELPVISKIKQSNENGQCVEYFTWDMLNMTVPSVLGLNHRLPENIGIIPFSPKLRPNEFPYIIYDTNTCGQIRLDILPFETNDTALTNSVFVNMKRGRILIASIGINALCIANLSLFRCMA